MKTRHATLALLTAIAAGPAAAGPFGVHEGMTLEELGALVRLQEMKPAAFWYESPTAPEPDAAFRSYAYVVSPTRGLCEVIATGHEFATDRAGARARERMAEVEHALAARYGPAAARVDTVAARASDAGDWTRELVDGRAQYAAVWYPRPGAGKHDAIREVNVHVKMLDLDTALVRITYRFDNSQACMQEAREEMGRRGPSR